MATGTSEAADVSRSDAPLGERGLRVLHVAAEIFPLIKTGGLADVVGALPQELERVGADVRLVLPGLPAIVDSVLHQKKLVELGPMFGAARITVMIGQMPFTHMPVYVIDSPYLYRRPGSPYQDTAGREWPDNLRRFALLGWVAAHLAAGELDLDWTPDVVHSHDWHAAMTCAYMATHLATRAASVFTIHNLAFQGLFPFGDFHLLGLPASFMATAGIEFHGQMSFIKAGLAFADRVTTVSPTYAREIATQEFGSGLDGMIRNRGSDVSGVLNGVDGEVWEPTLDASIAARYSASELGGKAACKRALQAEFGLDLDDASPIFGMVSRLTHQKGTDLLLAALPTLVRSGAQLALQGSGDAATEAAFRNAEQAYPGRVSVRLAYDELLAHRVIAGSDAILVPSRFEPCGLTQMYGLRYGTLPVVRRVGGLADTVVDADADAVAGDRATGFVFADASPDHLEEVLRRTVDAYRQPDLWRRMMRRAMSIDCTWTGAAQKYLEVYRDAMQSRLARPRVVSY